MELPIMNRTHAVLDLFGLNINITDTVIATWIIMSVLITFAVIVRIKMRKFKDVPKGFQNVVEFLVESFDNYLKGITGEKLSFLGYWFFTVFVFILLSNLSGILFIGLIRAPTADWSMVFALALVTFFLIQIMALKYRGAEYLKSLAKPYYMAFLFLPINIISELAKPISLSFRIFGNILSGVVIIAIVYNITPFFARIGFPIILHGYFDLFAGFLQAYIFVTIGLTFIANAVTPDET